MKRHSSVAKITQPTLAQVFPRHRLFELLDQGCSFPLTWISGPAGAGKTTLVASYLADRELPCIWYHVDGGDGDIATFFYYMGLAARKASPRTRRPLLLLTPECLADIPTFTLRYFENLCTRLKPPYLLVFENCQDAPPESQFHEVIRVGLSALPQGVRVVGISRSDPPPAFAGMLAGNKLFALGSHDLKLTPEESRGIVTLQGSGLDQDEASAWMHETTQGWAAGLVLLAHALKAGEVSPDTLENRPPETVFDYFANELFDRLGEPLQDFFLKTAFVRELSPRVALQITGNSSSGRILSDLNKRNYFTDKLKQREATYHYHSLLRKFLKDRAKAVFSTEEIANICRDAAHILVASEKPEEAAELYIEGQDWQGLVSLISNVAPTMMAQGRSKTINIWISSIPTGVREANPWLMYWQGMSRLLGDPTGARPQLERAYALFKQQEDRAGLLLSWAAIVDSYIHTFAVFTPLKRWIRELKRLLSRGWSFPSPEVEVPVTVSMFTALFFIQPYDQDLPLWERKMVALMKGAVDPCHRLWLASYLLMYYAWTGDVARMGSIRRELAAVDLNGCPPAAQLVWSTLDSVYGWYTAQFEMSLGTVRAALETAGDVGAHAWDVRLMVQGVLAALGAGDMETAQTYLDDIADIMKGRQHLGLDQYLYAKAYYHTLNGELAEARECAAQAVSLAEDSGLYFPLAVCSTGLAQVLVLQGRCDEAAVPLARAKRAGKRMRSLAIEIKASFLDAQMRLADGREKEAIRFLRMGFATAREKGYWSLDWWLPSVMTSLCEKALERDVETDYVCELIRRRRLLPAEPPYHVENWPWAVKILTLGRFELVRDGTPVRFAGKTQKKPLELLKALIALGGSDVADHQLANLLWPDSDGDAAYRSLLTTAQRLRKLLGSTEAVRIQGGGLSLDRCICWVDAWAFERLYRQARKTWKGDEGARAVPLLEQAVALYGGPFLGREHHAHGAVALRESLRSKSLDALSMLCRFHEEVGEWDKAADYYQRGLEIDEFTEEFYCGLMLCYQNLGNTGRALDVYRRCRTVLASGLGIAPSPETEAVRKAIVTGRSA